MSTSGDPLARVLVTGASGFVGAHVACAFFHDGWRVIAGVREKTGSWRLQHLLGSETSLELAQIDLLQPQLLEEQLAGCRPDLVVHCAAAGAGRPGRSPKEVFQVNGLSMPHLVEAARAAGARRFLHLGSCYEYGEVTGRANEQCPLKPKGVYAASKASGAVLGQERAKRIGLAWVTVRPFSLYGPFDWKHKLIPQLIEACRQGWPLSLTNGIQVRDFLYVQDLTAALIKVARHPCPAKLERFNIGSGTATSIRQLAAVVMRVVGKTGKFRWGRLALPDEAVKRIVCDPHRAEQRLGWRPQTTLEEGIRKILAAEQQEASRCAV